MGLIIQSLNTDTGLTITNSYARIDTIRGSKQELTLSLNYYVNQQASIDGRAYLKQEEYQFVPSVEDESANYHKQGYEHIKALPEFAGAIDA